MFISFSDYLKEKKKDFGRWKYAVSSATTATLPETSVCIGVGGGRCW
jgi:hypothetical protein